MDTTRDPIPHRKLIRAWMVPVSRRRTALPLLLSALDLSLFGLCIAAVVALRDPVLKLLPGMLAGFMAGRLFILAHDACHHSLTPHRALNRVLGRLLMLPSLTTYSLWDVGHNVVHHGYTNLKAFDFVWQPKTLAEYRALPAWRRLLERVYRSGWAPWLYYGIEMWWLRMFFPSRRYMPTRRRVFLLDSLLVLAAALLWIGGLLAAAIATGQSPWWLLLCGFLLPQLFWNAMIGFVVYVQHTHPQVHWYADKTAWQAAQPFVSTTVHVRFTGALGTDLGWLLHHINEHTAHHVDMTIPLYCLKPAQAILEARMPGAIVVQPFSWRWYFDTARRCKLYDYQRQQWLGFDGRPTRG